MKKGKWKKPLNAFLSAGLVTSLFVPAAVPSTVKAETVAAASDLIISEYIEGASYNKAIELYNGTGSSVDLSQYSLELYTNGSSINPFKLALSGELADKQTYVISHGQASAEILSKSDTTNSSVINFNGDDALVLKKSGNIVDSFGQLGVDPGTYWGTTVKTADMTLVRKSSVTSGDTIADDAFVPEDEWTALPKDDASNLGIHQMDGSAGENPGEPDPEEPGDVEIISIADARAAAVGETVTIKGVVAANLKNTVSVQDATGGIAVRPASLDAQVGDEVTLTGKLAVYRNLLQLDGAVIVEKNEAEAPASRTVTGNEIGEPLESQLVTVKNLDLTGVDSSGANFTATDGTGSFIVRDEYITLGLEVGTVYESITGIVQQFDNDYQIIPRGAQDIVVDSAALRPAQAVPGSGTFVGSTEVTLSTSTANAEIFYSTDGSEPTDASEKYTAPIQITEDTVLKTVVKAEDGTLSEVTTYEYTITDSLQIHDLQAKNHTSPFAGETVEGIEGIVTYAFQSTGSYYYHIQTPDELADNDPDTSEALVLYSGNSPWPITVGDLVSVTGQVSEYAIEGYSDRQTTDLKTTQITVRNDRGGNVTVLESGVSLPEPIVIDESNLPSGHIDSDNLEVFNPEKDAIDFWESLESMRVQVGDVKAVAPQENGDLVTVLESAETDTLHGGLLYEENDQNPNRIQFRLEPNGEARDFEVATGDKFEGPLTGVVGYSYQNYKIYAALADLEEAHIEGEAEPEQTTIVKAEDKLTVASYNLENFSNNKSSSPDSKAQKLARALATDMQSPDIIGVTEVQDNNGGSAGDSDASESYERLIAAIKAAGGAEYNYVNIDPVNNADGGAPNANIRVGFLYNPERVSLTEGIPAGDATTAVGYENGKLTHNPGRIDPTNSAFDDSRKPLAAQFDFKGESVVVIANHWNSKSGDTPLFGSQQPPVYGSEVQRHKIAKIVHDFAAGIKAENPDANIVSLGDFNDYQFSQSLKIHEGDIMTNMINKVEASDRYTYVYQGNSQVLDHILVSNNLVDNTKVDILHINADFTDMAGRASDHDPVLAQIDFSGETEVPITAEKDYQFNNFKTKKLTISKPSVSITVKGSSVIQDGIYFTGEYAEFHGESLADTKVVIKPAKADAIIDFKGTVIKEVVIDNSNVKEIRGAENVQKWTVTDGFDTSNIKFTNVKGEAIASPFHPVENGAPAASPISNQTVQINKSLTIDLSNYFTDPDGDELTYTSTRGNVFGSTLTFLESEEGTYQVTVKGTDGDKEAQLTFQLTVTGEQTEQPVDSYYTAAAGKTGSELKAALHDIIKTHKVLSYSQVWDALKETDEDPNNPNNVILLYSGLSRSKDRNGGNVGDWNREHVWAKSHGDFGTTNGPGTDIHHLRPTDVQVNSTRGNLDFANGGSAVTNCSDCKRSANSFEPPDRVKGDVARMLFYMAVRYENGDRVDLELNDLLNNGSNPYHGKLSVLLEWNEQDPVDAFEMNRNNVIYSIQENRNPFIDHPEWANQIFRTAN
ncbi:endonuclease [Bacillus sp. MMSF_3328]|uniref:endonuclease n=1 Tax=Bacillus sp. MMSF_3328 TaxID=3047080 RepID=UPI00273EB4C2|nr:endonuclease [Bacillus sp. MMSF_3328]